MIHSSLEPLNKKFKQFLSNGGGKKVKKASGRQFHFLKEQQKLALKLCRM